MDRLWAPWRSQYITTEIKERKGCFFCEYITKKEDKKNYILKRGKSCFIIMNKYPYNNGHLMIVPYRHIGDISLLTEEEQKELFQFLILSKETLYKVLNPDGFNIGINLGRVAGAGVEDHIHIHVVPRWNGDTNFMPVLGDTKVISQSLDELYGLLIKSFS